MEPFEFDFEDNKYIYDIVEKYENSLRNNVSIFLDSESFIVLAEFYEIRGDASTATDVIDRALEQYPFSASLLIKKAQILVDSDLHEDALDVLEKAELMDSSEVEIYLLRAEILINLFKYEEAIDLLKNRLSLSPEEEHPDIYLQMGDVYESSEDYDKFLDCLKNCLRIDQDNVEALSRIEYYMELTSDYKQTCSFLEALIEENPYSELTWYNLYLAHKGLNQLDKATDALEYLLAINENLHFAHQSIIELHILSENHTKALEEIKEYEDRFGGDGKIYSLKGLCHIKMEDYKLSRYYYRKVIDLQPNNSEANHRIGESYRLEGDLDQAFKYLSEAALLEKDNYDYQIAAVETAIAYDNLEEAFEFAEKALTIDGNKYKAYLYMAKSLTEIGDTEMALNVLHKGLSQCTSTIELRYALIGVLYAMGKRKDAATQLLLLRFEDSENERFIYLVAPEMENDMEINMILRG